MKGYRPSITIAISAYNEEENIKAFLESILSQKQDGFRLKKILIISDGSTDKTAEIAKMFKNKTIKVLEYKERTGKSTRLNEIYTTLKSDFLVQSDADVIFADKHTLQNIVKPMILDSKIGMCGGNPRPLKAETFTEKAVNITCEVYSKFRQKVRNGDNLFSADGRLLAFRKKLVKKINIPPDMIANDQYAYFACLMQGEKYKFAKNAIVFYRSPQTLKDHIRQNTRFLASSTRMAKYFPQELIDMETNIPTYLRIKEQFLQFIKHPVHSIYIFIINRYCQVKGIITEKNMDATWQIAVSTKALK